MRNPFAKCVYEKSLSVNEMGATAKGMVKAIIGEKVNLKCHSKEELIEIFAKK